MSTGPHFNPNNMDHGSPTDKIRHAGDLGNIEATAGGCDFTIEDMQIPLSGANSIIGRAFVIHELEDDLGQGDSSEIGTQGESRRDVDAFRRERARVREERETDGTTFPHVFFPVERKNFQNHRKRRRAFGVWNRRKGKNNRSRSLSFLFFSFRRRHLLESSRRGETHRKTSTRVRRAGSVNPIRPRRVSTLDTFSARRIDRGTPRVINYTNTPHETVAASRPHSCRVKRRVMTQRRVPVWAQKGKRNELESNRPSTHVASSDRGRHARVVDRTVGVLDVDAFGVVVGATRAPRPACASSAASSSSATRK